MKPQLDKLLFVLLWILGAPLGNAQPTASPSATAAGVPTTQRPLDRRRWLSDYEQLKSELERSYSHLARFGSPEGGVDLPALNRVTLQAIRRAKTNAEARAALLTFVSGFHDDHFALAPVPETANAALEPPQPAVVSDADVLVQPEMERGRSPLVNIPPCGRGFSRHPGLPIRCGSWKSAEGKLPRSDHRLDEPTGLSLGMVASHCQLPFRPARSL